MRKWVEFVVIGAENHQYDWTPWNLSRRGRILCRISEGLVCPEQCWEHRDGPASFPVIPSCPELNWCHRCSTLPSPRQSSHRQLGGPGGSDSREGHAGTSVNSFRCWLHVAEINCCWWMAGTGWWAASAGGFSKLHQEWELLVLGLEAKQRFVYSFIQEFLCKPVRWWWQHTS